MGFVFYGVKKATIGADEYAIYCPLCEADHFADFMISSNYFHLYFIPIFPFEKEANIICQKCGLKRYEVPFGPIVIKNYFELKNKFRHPWYTYFFLLFTSILILLTLVFS